MFELQHAIELSTILPSLVPTLARMVNTVVQVEEPEPQYMAEETNPSWALGSCLACLATRKRAELSDKVDLALWTKSIIRKWHWSGYVLEGLFALMNAR